jgi:hypothetical protein
MRFSAGLSHYTTLSCLQNQNEDVCNMSHRTLVARGLHFNSPLAIHPYRGQCTASNLLQNARIKSTQIDSYPHVPHPRNYVLTILGNDAHIHLYKQDRSAHAFCLSARLTGTPHCLPSTHTHLVPPKILPKPTLKPTPSATSSLRRRRSDPPIRNIRVMTHGCGAHSVSTTTLQTVVAKLVASHLYQLNAAVIDGLELELLLGEGGASRECDEGAVVHTATLVGDS